jgi:aromatic ring-opening dioxygenase LigB subunit
MEPCPPRVAVLMCHAPIVIPLIGQARASECADTTASMQAAALAVTHGGVETVLVVSPHTPRHPRAFGCVAGGTLRGDFLAFGRSGPESVFRGDPAVCTAVTRQAELAGLPLVPTKIQSLDHGALVPLWFLQQAGYTGTVAVFGFPWESGSDDARRFGEVLASAMKDQNRRWALVASGDMSHALKQGGPAGFHPLAHTFDEAVVACVREGRIGDVSGIDDHLRTLAAEDVVDSLETAEGSLGGDHTGRRFLSYEAPFGVGYMVAVLREAES